MPIEPPHPIRLSNSAISTWTWASVESDTGGTSYGRYQNQSGAPQYMMLVSNDTGAGTDGEWDFATSVGSSEMEAMMTSTTATILRDGTINGSTGLITYGGSTYRVRYKFASFALGASAVKKPIAEAYATGS